ncbi:hypothetical protein [Nocardia camponoti]|uniref:Uncharacterized protein n=1 Tax=Nocardia camponoti TaxID=1616106 RepID=A0A917QRJ4_9NOCA|nr:hypothetical protein [Nocardia camponoti]GGK64847.1 hypothetical protein GCM10011591_41370 [Nocardia camponoti]
MLTGPSAAQVPVVATFTPASQSYAYKNNHGSFKADVVYATDAGFSNRMFWTLTIDPSVQVLMTGNTMACTASVDGLPVYHDHHQSIPGDYKWHSTVKDLALNTPYTWRAMCAFGTAQGPGEVKFAVAFTMQP